jgi:hypothetical protein
MTGVMYGKTHFYRSKETIQYSCGKLEMIEENMVLILQNTFPILELDSWS